MLVLGKQDNVRKEIHEHVLSQTFNKTPDLIKSNSVEQTDFWYKEWLWVLVGIHEQVNDTIKQTK